MRKKLAIILMIFALAVFSTACKKASTVYYDAAMNYLENGEYEQAASDFSRSLAEEAVSKDCYRGYGIALFYAGHYDEAAEAFINALHESNGRIQPVDYDINDYLAKSYQLGGHYEEAVESYSALIELVPKNIDRYYKRAVCYLQLGKLNEAQQDFEVVTNADKDNYDLKLDIYFAISDAGFDDWADGYMESILTDGSLKISDYDRGRLNFYINNFSEARVYLEKAKDMSKPETVLMLGKTYEALGDYNYAGSLYNSYLNAKGNNAAIYNQLGLCRLKSEDYESALAAFTMGLSLENDEYTRELTFNEAITYEYLLDFETALKKMQAYSKAYPNDEEAKRELIFLKTRVQED